MDVGLGNGQGLQYRLQHHEKGRIGWDLKIASPEPLTQH